jgi:uncharacterized damage-inducible protein DinB
MSNNVAIMNESSGIAGEEEAKHGRGIFRSTIKFPVNLYTLTLTEKNMPINEMLLSEFDTEMANTRKTLQRVPADKWDWKPHEKSGTLGWLASHVATLPGFTVATINTSELEISTAKMPKIQNQSELIPQFEKSRDEARKALAGVTDEQLRETWTLKWNGNVVFAMPRYACLRGMCFNHIIHHRAQLTVYLRQLNVPVPGLYGPSADEKTF